jgi:hypothetical protein
MKSSFKQKIANSGKVLADNSVMDCRLQMVINKRLDSAEDYNL